MNRAYLLIGGNIGRREDYLSRARGAIADCCGTIVKASSLYETAAWGRQDQPPFLNQALCLSTSLDAATLLEALLLVEKNLGRARDEKYGPRTIDIDIILFNREVVQLPGLAIPHPRMQERRFVLEPLHEIAPGAMHPLLHQTVAQLLAACPDPLTVHKIS